MPSPNKASVPAKESVLLEAVIEITDKKHVNILRIFEHKTKHRETIKSKVTFEEHIN